MGSDVVIEYEIKGGNCVERVVVRTTDDTESYPSGWRYTLHYGTLDGTTLLRYDNAHEDTKGHERHSREGDERIEFPGMESLLDRFLREKDEL